MALGDIASDYCYFIRDYDRFRLCLSADDAILDWCVDRLHRLFISAGCHHDPRGIRKHFVMNRPTHGQGILEGQEL